MDRPQVLDRPVGGRIAPRKRPMPRSKVADSGPQQQSQSQPESQSDAQSQSRPLSQSPSETVADLSATGRLAAAQEKLSAAELRIAELIEQKSSSLAAEDFDGASVVQKEIKEQEDSASRLKIAIRKLERAARLEQKIAAQRGAGGGSPSAYASPVGSFRTMDGSPVGSQVGPGFGRGSGSGSRDEPDGASASDAQAAQNQTAVSETANSGAANKAMSAQEKKRRVAEYKSKLAQFENEKKEAAMAEDFAGAHQAKQSIIALQKEYRDVVGRASGLAGLGAVTREQVLAARLAEYIRKRDLLEARKREQSIAEDFQGAGDTKQRIEVLAREYNDVAALAPSFHHQQQQQQTLHDTSDNQHAMVPLAAPKQNRFAPAAQNSARTSSSPAAVVQTPSSSTASGQKGWVAARVSTALVPQKTVLSQAELDALSPEVRRDYELGLGRFASLQPTPAATTNAPQRQQLSQAELEKLPPEVRRDYELGIGRFAPQQGRAVSRSEPPQASNASQSSSPSAQPQHGASDRIRKAGSAVGQDARLYMAARGGHLTVISKLVEQEKLPVDSVHFETGNTALFGAIEKDAVDIARWLLEHGASVAHKNRRGETALHYAIERRKYNIADLVLDYGADVSASDNLGRTPFTLSAGDKNFQENVLKKAVLKQMAQQEEEERARAAAPREELITMFVKGGKQQTFNITQKIVISDVLRQFVEHKNLGDLALDLEVIETVMGRENVLALDRGILSIRDKWPNTNPAYCKFTIRLKRGTDMQKQVKFREAI